MYELDDDFLSVDFEGRSVLNLKKVGAHRYARHETTQAYCMGYAFGRKEKPSIWKLGDPIPRRVAEHVKANKRIHAWNAAFERLIWRHIMVERLGWPEVRDRQWRCTMARAQACGLPAGLDNAAVALRLEERKDKDGGKAMQKLSKPRKVIYGPDNEILYVEWWEPEDRPDLYEQTYSYCMQDVTTERAAGFKLPHLSMREQELYFLDQQINDEGIKFDRRLAENAIKVEAEAKEILEERCVALCGIAPSQTVALRQWLVANDCPIPSLDRDIVKRWLKKDIPKLTKDVLAVRLQAAKSSVAKYKKGIECVCDDGYLHGLLRFLGAAATGRWSSQLLQLQNMAKAKLVDRDGKTSLMMELVQLIRDGANFHTLELLFGQPMQALADAVRGILCVEEDEEMYSADLRNIESRVIAEQAGEEAVLKAWREFDAGTGPDLYVREAAKLFNIKPEQVDDDKRFWGKQEVLGLGFGGGPAALIKLAEKAGGDVADLYPFLHKRATMKMRERAMTSWHRRGRNFKMEAWCAASYVVMSFRTNNTMIVDYWDLLEKASVAAVVHKGKVFRARKIRYQADDNWLWCTLPSGRKIAYAHPRVEMRETPWGATQMTLYAYYLDTEKYQWKEFNPYGGFLSENVVQGDARDIIAYRLPHLKKAGYMPILSVHDEAVAKRKKDTGGSLKDYISILAAPVKWAPDLPVAASGWVGQHYRK